MIASCGIRARRPRIIEKIAGADEREGRLTQ